MRKDKVIEDLEVQDKDEVIAELMNNTKEELVTFIMNQAVTIENIYHDLQLYSQKYNDAIESRDSYISIATDLQAFKDNIVSFVQDIIADEHLYGGVISTQRSGNEWLAEEIAGQFMDVPVDVVLSEGEEN